MWFQQRDVELAHISGDMDFSLYGRERHALVEGKQKVQVSGNIS